MRALRQPVRSLVYIFWVYTLASSLTSGFVQIFLYQKFSSIELNVVSIIIFYTGIACGFCMFGYIASVYRLNIKQGFFWSFLGLGASLLVLLQITSPTGAFVALLIEGIGQGLFWLTIHTFELSETHDHERDIYSSLLVAGGKLLALAGPALATGLIWFSGTLHWGAFTLLFLCTPFLYLLGFFCFGGISDYRPNRILRSDLKHFVSDNKNRVAQFYLLATSFQQVFGTVVTPLAIFFVLGTAFKVGVFQTILALASVGVILIVAQYRKPQNRLALLGVLTALFVPLTVWFGYELTLLVLVVYMVGEEVIFSLMGVSTHIIDLKTMESIGQAGSDFYPTMIFRDASLWFWRAAGGLVLLMFVHSVGTERAALTGGLYLFAGSIVLVYVSALWLMRHFR